MLLIDTGVDNLELHMGRHKVHENRVRFRLMQRQEDETLNWIATYHDNDETTESDDYIDFEGDVPHTFLAGSVVRWVNRFLDDYLEDDDEDVIRFTPYLNDVANRLQDAYAMQDGLLTLVDDTAHKTPS